jgi:hypothetical protein
LGIGGVTVPLLEDLQACVINECDEACKPGRHWDCVCKYSASEGYAGETIDLILTVVIVGAPRPPQVRIRACTKVDLDCASPALTIEAPPGRVTIQVPSSSPDGFRGSFLVDSPGNELDAGVTTFLPTNFAESIPYTPRVSHFGVLQARAFIESYLTAGSLTLDRSRSYASVFPYDCQLMPAANLQAEAIGGDPSTRTVYWVSGTPDLNADRTTPLPSDGLNILFAPPTAIDLVMRDADSHAEVSSFRYRSTPDSYLFLRLYPKTKSECSP